ncbi:MAG: hypothetical protein GY757_56725 [bacterium]|nr:hypothetical protein [bacterium]
MQKNTLSPVTITLYNKREGDRLVKYEKNASGQLIPFKPGGYKTIQLAYNEFVQFFADPPQIVVNDGKNKKKAYAEFENSESMDLVNIKTISYEKKNDELCFKVEVMRNNNPDYGDGNISINIMEDDA